MLCVVKGENECVISECVLESEGMQSSVGVCIGDFLSTQAPLI